ncbi:hypothetical protein [Leptospira yanagawae]|uniref:hypothetical protein n=1 Tax=Leptospira yanagawae TaxID=293069 RepID=UPI001427E9ED|nr:hypothetical protein [Leptospira yanagawae]
MPKPTKIGASKSKLVPIQCHKLMVPEQNVQNAGILFVNWIKIINQRKIKPKVPIDTTFCHLTNGIFES